MYIEFPVQRADPGQTLAVSLRHHLLIDINVASVALVYCSCVENGSESCERGCGKSNHATLCLLIDSRAGRGAV